MRVIFLIDPEDELNCQNIKINFYEKHIDTNNRYQVINFMHNSIEPNILSTLLRQNRYNQNMKINEQFWLRGQISNLRPGEGAPRPLYQLSYPGMKKWGTTSAPHSNEKVNLITTL